MILKFWPRWPQKRPLNLSSLGGRPLDFNLNGIFEISGLHWSKWAIACLIRRTFIFWIFSLQPPRLLTSPVNIFNDYIFEISLFHWSKCTIECAICLTLILKSVQARCVPLHPFLLTKPIEASKSQKNDSKFSTKTKTMTFRNLYMLPPWVLIQTAKTILDYVL